MNFFNHQDQAKNKIFKLLLLFIIGLILLCSLVSLLFHKLFSIDYSLYKTTLCMMALILITAAYRYSKLTVGGKAITLLLEGRLLNKSSNDLKEQQLLNIVEELAIAAQLPVPPIYILDSQKNINSLAAGFTADDAVIGVTKGAVQLLTRDELQALIGHEVSHIINGDMRLNIRFTALLYCFYCITDFALLLLTYIFAGKLLSFSDDKRFDPIFIIALCVSGCILSIGLLFSLWAKIMQSAINKQREFLADASAVQFTRHAPSLATLLKKVGGKGSRLKSLNSKAYNHFFFAKPDRNIFFPSHPSLKKRILKLEPQWNGQYIMPILENKS